jgi:truncated hemoglobin YjbI
VTRQLWTQDINARQRAEHGATTVAAGGPAGGESAPVVADVDGHTHTIPYESGRPGSLLELLGGERVLAEIVNSFVDRTFSDEMIGYMFRAADRQRVKAKEFEFASGHLGGTRRYTGRALGAAHAPHRVQLGQFNRRLELLRVTLVEAGAPAPVIQHWLEHTERLAPVILTPSDACGPAEVPTSLPGGSAS